MKAKFQTRIKYYILVLVLLALVSATIAGVLTAKQVAQAEEFTAPTSLAQLQQADPAQVATLTRFDSRDYGIVPAIRNQGGDGICWAFATISAVEISILREGIGDYTADNINLSEKQLSWITKNRIGAQADPLGNTDEYEYSNVSNYLEGEFVETAMHTLLQWTAPVQKYDAYDNNHQRYPNEGEVEFLAEEVINLSDKIYNKNASTYDRDIVKEAIAKYGAVTMVFWSSGLNTYFNNVGGAYADGRHACAIVGWDDTIEAEKFGPDSATQDGAWIVRNSWGTSSGQNGYFYYSYDGEMNGVCAIDMTTSDEYDNNYYYDAIPNDTGSYISNANATSGYDSKASVIFQASATSTAKEYLKGINVFTDTIGRNTATVTVEIYKGVSANRSNAYSTENQPESGTLVRTLTRTVRVRGNRFLPLDDPLELTYGEYFSIVVTVKDGYVGACYVSDGTVPNSLSYCYDASSQRWGTTFDLRGKTVARIKAFTITGGATNPYDMENAEVDVLDECVYEQDLAQTPDIRVTIGGKELIGGQDYIATYSDCIMAGDDATITIRGKGKYFGEKVVNFTIEKAYMPEIRPEEELSLRRGTYSKVVYIDLPDGWSWTTASANVSLDWIGRRDTALTAKYDGYDKSCYEVTEVEVYVTLMTANISDCNLTLLQTEYGYTGNSIIPLFTIKDASGNELKVNDEYSIQYANNTMPGIATVTISGVGYYVGEIQEQFTITGSMSDAVVTVADNAYTYEKDVERKPNVEVKFAGVTLNNGADYSVSYSNNILAGDNATVTITGKGFYAGEKIATFTIAKATVAENAPQSAMSFKRGEYAKVKDIELSANWQWTSDCQDTLLNWIGSSTTAMVAEYVAIDKDCYVTTTVNVSITLEVINLSECDIELSAVEFNYTGDAITPIVTVKDLNGTTLNVNEDYSIQYTDNTMPGTGKVKIIGGDYYVGEVEKQFTVKGNVSDASLTVADSSFTYEKNVERKPNVEVQFAGVTLVKDVDYSVSYTNNILAGNATVTITGMGYYAGTNTETFTIGKATMPANAPQSAMSFQYNQYAKVADIALSANWQWASECQDTLLNWIGSSTTAMVAEYVATDKDCYETVTVNVTMTLTAINLSECDIELSAVEFDYTGEAIIPTVTVKDANGNVLKVDEDYTIEYTNNTNVGTGKIKIKGIGYYAGERNATFTIRSVSDDMLSVAMVATMALIGTFVVAGVVTTLVVLIRRRRLAK